MEILFVHGAGGWRDDQPMAAALRAQLGSGVVMPRFPDEDMCAAAWWDVLDRELESLGPELVVVGHSFGASMLLLRLADGWPGGLPRGMVLLAAPFWGSQGWQAEYALPSGFAAPAGLPLFLHHCRDDGTVPFDHLERLESLLPDAVVRRHDSGGHQFEGRMPEVAADVGPLIS